MCVFILHDKQALSADININGQKLEEVTSFKYLEATPCKEGFCSTDVRTRIASAMAATGRLNRIWRCNTISFASKFQLYKSLATSILLYRCETWTLLADSGKKIFENRVDGETSPYLLLGAQDKDWVRSKINFLVGPQEPLLATVKRRKLAWFGHITLHDSPSKTILQGILEDGRRRGRQRRCWMAHIKEWTYLLIPELLLRTSCRQDWKRISAESSLVFPQ